MRLLLPSGKQLKIGVRHDPVKKKRGVYTQTTIVLSNEAGTQIASGTSLCSPLDHFSKLTGRKLALKELFASHPFFNKADRLALWQKLCGKLVKTPA